MNLRRFAGFVALVVGAFVVGSAYFGSPGGVGAGSEIRNLTVEASTSDEVSVETGPDGARSCTTVGPPPGMMSVRIRALIDDRRSGRYESSTRYRVVAEIAKETTDKTVSVTDGFEEPVTHVTLVPADGVEPDDRLTANVSLVSHGNTVDTATRTVTVDRQKFRCVEVGD